MLSLRSSLPTTFYSVPKEDSKKREEYQEYLVVDS